jgi:HEAT repeat protein
MPLDTTRSDVPALPAALAALHDGDPEVRAKAAGDLQEIPDAAALFPLIGALNDESIKVRAAAAWALGFGELADRRAVGPLISLAADKSLAASSPAKCEPAPRAWCG